MSTSLFTDRPLDLDAPLSDRTKGLLLAVSSSIFIGASFIVKKKGLRAAGATGIRAGETTFASQVKIYSLILQLPAFLQAVEVTRTSQSHYGGLAC